MGVYAGPSNAWSNSTDSNRIDASTKVIVQSGLVLHLDAGSSTSYSGSGTTWTDISGNVNTGTLKNGPTSVQIMVVILFLMDLMIIF